MTKSAFAAVLDGVQKPVTALLKNVGFKRRGRAYNRAVRDGLVHAVSFQMGQFPIGEYVIPGIRESFYGRFTVNLGVMLPAVLKLETERDPPSFVPEYHCQIRQRLGTLVYNEDVWWDLDHQADRTAHVILELLDQHGIPFLDQFEDHSSVVTYLERLAAFLPTTKAAQLLWERLFVFRSEIETASCVFLRNVRSKAVRSL